jgi:hypothetical protein
MKWIENSSEEKKQSRLAKWLKRYSSAYQAWGLVFKPKYTKRKKKRNKVGGPTSPDFKTW